MVFISEIKRFGDEINILTDLALESAELLTKNSDASIPGVDIVTEESKRFNIKATTVKIVNADGERAMGRPMGNYLTIESEAMKTNDIECHEEIVKILSDKIVSIKKLDKDALVLVAGLGNRSVTPDSLGPRVASKILVTRGMMDAMPEEIKGKTRVVAGIAPGVMGTTGIETVEIINGIAEHIKPDLIIAVDALAARSAQRINACIQISDCGVNPGAGMGNKRKPLNKETVGTDVIAIGVPTVVDAATLVNDTLDYMLESMIKESGEGGPFYEMLSNLESEDKYELIRKTLDPYMGNMFVTPKDIGVPHYV